MTDPKDRRRRFAGCLRLAGALIGLALLAACAAPRPRPELFWPPKPAAPQIAFEAAIGDYKEAGIRVGLWRKVLDAMAGETDERIGRPYGVFHDDQDRLFIVDTAFGLVHVMDVGRGDYSTIGHTGDAPLFKTPIGVAGDDSGNVYITDSAAGMVFRYSLRDRVLTPFIETLQRPTGIAFSKRKRLLYVADTLADRVAVFDLNGNPRFSIGESGDAPGTLNHPTDVFVDAAGVLYVTDPLNYRIQIFSGDGGFLRGFGAGGYAEGELLKPKGVAADSSGNVYVVDALTDSVKVYDRGGRYRFAFGSNGDAPGSFWQPSGLYIDGADRIYVGDTYNRRVQLFRRVQQAPAAAKEK